ncbi:MAG: hypothetical protein QM500_02220 [Methylococcales bacterium]
MIYTVSGRKKPSNMKIIDFLECGFPDIQLNNIDSVFGFVEERSTLYGGREFKGADLTETDVNDLYAHKIGVRLPLTNHIATEEEFEDNRSLLEKYHKKGNAVIITNDLLAKRIRSEFPKYRIEASVIKNINTHDKIKEAFELYDTVVLPMSINQDLDFLRKAKNKKNITLFANAGCALNCTSKICYPSFSKMNKYNGGEFQCSQRMKIRELQGMIDFDLQEFVKLGFTRFKVLRSKGWTGN